MRGKGAYNLLIFRCFFENFWRRAREIQHARSEHPVSYTRGSLKRPGERTTGGWTGRSNGPLQTP